MIRTVRGRSYTADNEHQGGEGVVHPEAERAAAAVLRELWDEQLPVDPIRIARGLGIGVRVAWLAADWSGALVKRRGEAPEILLNEDHSRTRQRFTCAHELGHWFYRAAHTATTDSDTFEFIDSRDSRASQGTDPIERYANGFAAALLMPADRVRKWAKEEPEALLAWRFEVSSEAMRLRLRNLGML